MISILDLVSSKVITPGRQVAATKGGEYHMPCPRCHGKDRFHVWPSQGEGGTWWCRECDRGGDTIEFLRYFDGLSFSEACDRLGVERAMQYRQLPSAPLRPAPEQFSGIDRELPPDQWRERAAVLVEKANMDILENEKLLGWLNRRGIGVEAVKKYRLGWLAGDRDKRCCYRPRASWGLPEIERKRKDGKTAAKKLWIPRGLVIPTIIGDQVISLRIRRPETDLTDDGFDKKYYVVPGSALLPMTASENNCRVNVWVVVESQLDAITVAEQCGKILPAGAMAVLSNTGKPSRLAHQWLMSARQILVALDYDKPGQRGSSWWLTTYTQALRWPVPMGKDPGEAVSLGVNLAEWIADALPERSPLANAAGSAGNFQVGLPAGEEEAKEKVLAAEKKQVDRTVTCEHDLVTFDLLLSDLLPGQPFYIVCGEKVVSLESCLQCSGRPHGLRDLAVKMERACA